ncbi:MAG TPA: hypothetical protein VGG64_19510 [Pirellulales bacterium]
MAIDSSTVIADFIIGGRLLIALPQGATGLHKVLLCRPAKYGLFLRVKSYAAVRRYHAGSGWSKCDDLEADSMDANDLTTEQAARIREALVPAMGYLGRLRERMDKTGFTPDDKLRGLTSSAYEAMHHLCVELHYLSCSGGVGRRRRH